MNGWDQRLRTTRLDFIDRLERHGFTRATENIWRGTITSSGTLRKVEVSIGDSWPYLPPIVLPLDNELADSWHCTRIGGLCLYIEEDRTKRPWLDADSLVARITDWFDQAESSWPQDTPDLDLDRYFDPANPRLLVLYDDLELLLERSIRTRKGHNNTVEVTGAGPAARKAKRRELRFGYCADIGTPAKPPKRWSDLEPLIRDGEKVAKGIRDGRYGLLLLRYTRAGREVSLPSPPSRTRTTRSFFEHISRPGLVLPCDGCALARMPRRSTLRASHLWVVEPWAPSWRRVSLGLASAASPCRTGTSCVRAT